MDLKKKCRQIYKRRRVHENSLPLDNQLALFFPTIQLRAIFSPNCVQNWMGKIIWPIRQHCCMENSAPKKLSFRKHWSPLMWKHVCCVHSSETDAKSFFQFAVNVIPWKWFSSLGALLMCSFKSINWQEKNIDVNCREESFQIKTKNPMHINIAISNGMHQHDWMRFVLLWKASSRKRIYQRYTATFPIHGIVRALCTTHRAVKLFAERVTLRINYIVALALNLYCKLWYDAFL